MSADSHKNEYRFHLYTLMQSLGQVAYNKVSLEININNHTGRFNSEKNDIF
jgi:hypothetical protein